MEFGAWGSNPRVPIRKSIEKEQVSDLLTCSFFYARHPSGTGSGSFMAMGASAQRTGGFFADQALQTTLKR